MISSLSDVSKTLNTRYLKALRVLTFERTGKKSVNEKDLDLMNTLYAYISYWKFLIYLALGWFFLKATLIKNFLKEYIEKESIHIYQWYYQN